MGSGVVVLPEPAIDYDLCLLGRCEPFGIENLAAVLHGAACKADHLAGATL